MTSTAEQFTAEDRLLVEALVAESATIPKAQGALAVPMLYDQHKAALRRALDGQLAAGDDPEREAFEAWVLEVFPGHALERIRKYGTGAPGAYVDNVVRFMHEGWQARGAWEAGRG